jgi:hypothetical protein
MANFKPNNARSDATSDPLSSNDAGELSKLVQEIKSHHADVLAHNGKSLDSAIEAGTKLTTAKSKVSHGQWLIVLKDCDVKPRMAQTYMRVSGIQYLAATERAEFDGLTITEAEKLIARKSGRPARTSVKTRTQAARRIRNLLFAAKEKLDSARASLGGNDAEWEGELAGQGISPELIPAFLHCQIDPKASEGDMAPRPASLPPSTPKPAVETAQSATGRAKTARPRPLITRPPRFGKPATNANVGEGATSEGADVTPAPMTMPIEDGRQAVPAQAE